MIQLLKSHYLRLFTAASFLLIALFSTILYTTGKNQLEKSLLILAEERANNLSQQMMLIVQEKIINTMVGENVEEEPTYNEILQKLDQEIFKHFQTNNIARVVLYDENMNISYATEHELIGKDASRNEYLRRALNGEMTSGIVKGRDIDDFDRASAGLFGTLFEIYTPFVFQGKEGPIKGVIELYLYLTLMENQLREQETVLIITVAFGSLAFFLTLLFIAGRIELERIRADKVLLESERRFEDVAANSGEWIWETDAQGKYTYASPVVERVIGYTPEEVTGKYFHEFLIPAERDAVKEKVAGAFSQKQSFVNLPTRKVHKKGHIVETETSGVPFVDKEGALLGYRGAVQDVTERKLAVEALKKKTELIQLLQEITVAANEASTAEEAMFTCIKKVCAYTGWDIGHVYLPDSEGTLIPTDIWSINDRGRFESFREVSMGITFAPGVGLPGRVYKSGEPAWIMDVTVDLNFLRVRIAKKVGLKTGLAFPVLERKKIAAVLTFFTVEIKKPDESLLDAVALLATQLGRVTERKRAEEALRESEERFRSVAQTANDAIISSDREGKIISWNKGARRMFGYQEEETVGEPLTILMPEKYRQAHQTGLDRFLSTGEAKFIGKTMELKGLRKNGSEFSLDFSLSSWEIGKKTFFTAIIRDITDRILGEEELRQAKDKAEKATQLKDRFLSRAAHDLRAPVGSILGLLQIIENPDTDALHRKKLTGRAIIRCNGMLDMIAEMLNINMFKAGEINPEKVFTQMRILAETATEKLHYAAGEKDIKLVNNIAEGVRIYVDKQLIEGVLQNLISNAIKFSPRGGVVTLSTPESERMTIAVKDAGVGIGKDFLENIFDHNVKTTTLGTAGEKGTGLGMPISKDIVEAHGGSLTVETVEGDGSVFYMALPTVRPKILIVEDDPDYRFILKEILKEVDADIIEADDGGSAIKAMENNTPNMIITDCEMPGMNGFEFIEWIRNDERAKSVPIIVVTHRTDQEALTRALGAGANDFFTKAIVKEDFMKCIRRYIK